jgi:cobalt-zinc-cadmium efflux system protein
VAHAHSHSHDHGPLNYNAAFGVGIGLNLLYVVVEAGYGLSTGSLALVADAGHNLSDVVGLVLAWVAATLAARPPTPRRTYGLRRSSILAALGNAVLLLVAVGAIAWEAIGRLRHPEAVAGNTVMIVAGVGIAVNTATALLFMRGRESDLNLQGAFLHMAADALVSVGVVGAGFFIQRTGQLWIDPLTSLLVVAIITWGTWSLLRRSLDMALDAVPDGIDPIAVRTYLEGVPGVESIHDLHIWGMSTTEAALTVHVVAPTGLSDHELRGIGDALHDQFGIEHPTIQVERGTAGECPLAPDAVV